MKKNDWILLASVSTYSYLFYDQSAGINFILFTLALIALLLLRNKELFKSKNWLLAAGGSLLSSICVAYYGNSLSVIANIVSLMLLSAYSIEAGTSVVLSFLFSWFSIIGSFVFMILDAIARFQNRRKNGVEIQPGSVKLMLYLVPFIFVVLFFAMYKMSNPVFDNFTKKINLDFITIGWFFFTLGGFFLLYGFFYHKTTNAIAAKDIAAPNTLYESDNLMNKVFSGFLTIDNEKRSGIILFLSLNALLLLVNALDVNYLWFDGKLPADLSYSAFVHQGTGALITSIIIAILIILFYFRGALNFYNGNKTLKLLASAWIFQNAFMIVSTAYRNRLYIDEYGLTYKRIGVYIWLLLVLIGLVTTFVKVVKAKSNWYLFRINGWLFYGVLLISCFINWDVVLSNFNIERAQQKHRPLDINYLTSLSSRNLPQLLCLPKSTRVFYNYNDYLRNDIDTSNSFKLENNDASIYYNLYSFMNQQINAGWKSYCFENERVYKDIIGLKDKITSINLENNYKESLLPLKPFNAVKILWLTGNRLQKMNELSYFPQLEDLTLSNNYLDTIQDFPKLLHLTKLNLSGNQIADLSALKNAPNLTFLDISGNGGVDTKTFPALQKLSSLNMDGNHLQNTSYLQNLPQLQSLYINGTGINKSVTLPVLPQLKTLTLQGARISEEDFTFIDELQNFENLESLNLANNNFEDVTRLLTFSSKLYQDELLVPKFESLTSINIANNAVRSIKALSAYPQLQELYLSGNPVKNLELLVELHNLNTLYIDNCGINSLEFLKGMKSLTTLDVSNNLLSNFAPLYELKGLVQLNVGTISKSALAQLKQALPNTTINGNAF